MHLLCQFQALPHPCMMHVLMPSTTLLPPRTQPNQQVRKFAYEQYAATGLNMHPGFSPVEVKKQANGKLTCVVQDKDGNKVEITDNDQVS